MSLEKERYKLEKNALFEADTPITNKKTCIYFHEFHKIDFISKSSESLNIQFSNVFLKMLFKIINTL